MTDNTEKINQLMHQLSFLLKKHEDFSKEIYALQTELNQLKDAQQKTVVDAPEVAPVASEDFAASHQAVQPEVRLFEHQKKQEQLQHAAEPTSKPAQKKSDLEKFIGENLINKIGIAITVIGVAIGAKYSIENNLISPLTRIVMGYLFGLGLLGFGIKLKKQYENYSAVLVSGAMAIMYFITYSAYDLYGLIPQIAAFLLMFVFTAFTVIAALNYNRQVIAHIGLVGAYAVPFFLSDGSGNIAVLFTYMAIINIGILAIAFKKYWKPLYYASFGFTWLIFLTWFISEYQTDRHFKLALFFIAVFFALFYLTFLAYKLLQKEKFSSADVVLLMLNSFVFYGLGYDILCSHVHADELLGLFTLANAVVHFVVSFVIFKQKLADKNIHYLVTGLTLIFLTLAIPVQLEGHWVTLLWVGEAALLFWIGRTKSVSFYEKSSYILMLLAFFSLLDDWSSVYDSYNPEEPASRITPLLNVNFLSSVLFIGAFVWINVLHLNKKYTSYLSAQQTISKVISAALPAVLIFSVYGAFRVEIANYWNQLYADSMIRINTQNKTFLDYYWNNDYYAYKVIWVINYSLVFVSALSFLNLRKIQNKLFGQVLLGLIVLALMVFLIQGLYCLSELRESYLQQDLAQYYQRGTVNLWIRYVSFLAVALTLYVCYHCVKENFVQRNYKRAFELVLHTTILWMASSELIHWMDVFRSEQSYKLGLSILWGTYSLFLIALGIWKKNKPLRIGAIALFGITLIKLFFYDMTHLNTLAKIVVFVSLGVLLLIISFLYNKYKHLISDEPTAD
ncbi:MAG: DUF2339 domain-containing protein [Flavobacteriaceae bacterium]